MDLPLLCPSVLCTNKLYTLRLRQCKAASLHISQPDTVAAHHPRPRRQVRGESSLCPRCLPPLKGMCAAYNEHARRCEVPLCFCSRPVSRFLLLARRVSSQSAACELAQLPAASIQTGLTDDTRPCPKRSTCTPPSNSPHPTIPPRLPAPSPLLSCLGTLYLQPTSLSSALRLIQPFPALLCAHSACSRRRSLCRSLFLSSLCVLA